MSDFKDYERKLIQTSRNTAVLLHLFHKDPDHEFEDIFLEDICDKVIAVDYEVYEEAADQFIKQLEGYWCVAFCRALRDKCDALIKEHKEKCKKYENLHNK